MTCDEWTEDDRPPCQFCGEDACLCPPEPLYCAHRVEVGDYCPACAIAGEAELNAAVQRAMRGGGR